MKKFLTTLLSIIMISMCAFSVSCGNSKTEKEPVKVQLTTENYKEYLTIFEGVPTYNTSKKYDSLLKLYKYSGTVYATIEISSMSPNYVFQNVAIEGTAYYGAFCATSKLSISLDTKGNAKKNILCSVNDSFVEPDFTHYTLKISSITGYIIV